MNPRRALAPLAVLAVLPFTACGADEPVQRVSLTLPLVADGGAEAPLRVSGNVQRGVRLGDATLLALADEEIELYEPFEKRRMRFRAAPLRDVLGLAGIEPEARTLHAVALNDYVVDIPLDVALADGVYLAVRDGAGAPLPVSSGGPLRIVFTDDAKGADVENYWIWSLATVRVK
ncbi:molybdopterin-dependent oxidoreductase [Solirubrobacter phytolaccae]|uniref:Molybdopterin-dependent oxidoreductase n=1 Tax=Solirubrobacter phytolaccae TaxID=1404360 RepID=A0A9X3NDS2_9ACTN|nr:molybdopterin-dependent oxidoreductase [Solirubrobacter phytolaccae]MDA0183037.1 molybdopterin-dependent oxidoreductase [Solirubrobacter phytolaccae]